jgi:hypothetical protein
MGSTNAGPGNRHRSGVALGVADRQILRAVFPMVDQGVTGAHRALVQALLEALAQGVLSVCRHELASGRTVPCRDRAGKLALECSPPMISWSARRHRAGRSTAAPDRGGRSSGCSSAGAGDASCGNQRFRFDPSSPSTLDSSRKRVQHPPPCRPSIGSSSLRGDGLGDYAPSPPA